MDNHFTSIPKILIQQHIYPLLDRNSWNSLASVNRELYNASQSITPPWPYIISNNYKQQNNNNNEIIHTEFSVSIINVSYDGMFIVVADRNKPSSYIKLWHVRYGMIPLSQYHYVGEEEEEGEEDDNDDSKQAERDDDDDDDNYRQVVTWIEFSPTMYYDTKSSILYHVMAVSFKNKDNDSDVKIQLWLLSSEKQQQRAKKHRDILNDLDTILTSPIGTMTWSFDGTKLAAASQSEIAVLSLPWLQLSANDDDNCDTQATLSPVAFRNQNIVIAMQFSPHKTNILVSVCWGNIINVLDINQESCLFTLPQLGILDGGIYSFIFVKPNQQNNQEAILVDNDDNDISKLICCTYSGTVYDIHVPMDSPEKYKNKIIHPPSAVRKYDSIMASIHLQNGWQQQEKQQQQGHSIENNIWIASGSKTANINYCWSLKKPTTKHSVLICNENINDNFTFVDLVSRPLPDRQSMLMVSVSSEQTLWCSEISFENNTK